MNNPNDIAPLLRPAEIKEPGLYRFRRDSDQPWGFAFARNTNGGGLSFLPVQPDGNMVSGDYGWHDCTDRERGQFAPGPIDPVPSAQVTVSAEDARLLYSYLAHDCMEERCCAAKKRFEAAVEALPPLP